MDTDDVTIPFRSDVEEKAVKLGEFKNRNVTDVRPRHQSARLEIDPTKTRTSIPFLSTAGRDPGSFIGDAKDGSRTGQQ